MGNLGKSVGEERPLSSVRGATALLLPRVLGALALRRSVYADVAKDPIAALQSTLVVLMSAAIEGAAFAAFHGEDAFDTREIVPMFVAAPIGWAIWGGIVWLVGVRALQHPGEFPAIMRAIGMAHATGLILGLALVPGLSILTGALYIVSIAWFVGALWAAIGGALGLQPERALLVTAVSLVAHETFRQGHRLVGCHP